MCILNTDLAEETAAGKHRGIVSDLTARPSFALVTPYTGGNLGDGAIQEAVIWNIRRRFPDAAISGITLNPADTVERHRIPSYPISWFSRREYTVMLPSRAGLPSGDGALPTGHTRLRSKVGKRLASVPVQVARLIVAAGLALVHPERDEPYSQGLRIPETSGCPDLLGRRSNRRLLGGRLGTSLCNGKVGGPGATEGSQADVPERRFLFPWHAFEPTIYLHSPLPICLPFLPRCRIAGI